MQTDLKSISQWETENIFTQRWRVEASFSLIARSHFDHFFEFGCDTGFFTQKLATISKRVLALDINKEAVEYAQTTKLSPNISWLISDLQVATIDEGGFDGMSFLECLYYFDDEVRETMIKKAYRGLRKNGLLLFGGPIQQEKSKWKWDESRYFPSIESIESFLKKHHFEILKGMAVATSSQWITDSVNQTPGIRFLYPGIMRTINAWFPGSFRNYVVLAKKKN